MIHIALQSEYSFQEVYYHLEQLVKDAVERGDSAVGIADTNNTFGHVKFERLCEKNNIKPIFGVRLIATKTIEKARSFRKSCDQQVNLILLAKNSSGLREIYELTKLAYDRFYYAPRLLYQDVLEISDNVIIIGSHQPSDSKLIAHRFDFTESNGAREYPAIPSEKRVEKLQVFIPYIRYSKQEDLDVYEVFSSAKGSDIRTYGGYICSDDRYISDGAKMDDISNANHIADSIDHAHVLKSGMIDFPNRPDFDKECMKGVVRRGIDLDDPVYKERFDTEILMIKSKEYVDYFLMVADIIVFAKTKMLVGPARGSSAGSLVCYLLGITEIDPIKYGLLFNRFIDVNRFDLPDIDTDFADSKRSLVLKYLKKKYGADNVAAIGTVSTMKPKSAIGEFAKAMHIPEYEIEDVKNSIIKRSGGDARAKMCVEDTLLGTDAGKKMVDEHPSMMLVPRIEGHARHSGKHAAGIIVSNHPLTEHCGVDSRNGIIMMDKYDAAYIGILKIDVLGLRTLSILEETAKLVGFSYLDFYDLPLDDKSVFNIFNANRYSAIFQFEGAALQIVAKSMGVHTFDDIIAITALARPGALNSGGTEKYIKRHIGEDDEEYFDDIHKEITSETHGTVVFQEQMMMIAKRIGNMTWSEVSELRAASSRSLGDEFFGKYMDKFIDGAMNINGYSEEQAKRIWKGISSSGSWIFNKSHAVSYSLISYWTAWCKAHYPLEYAASNLNHARDDDNALRILRDFVVNDGIKYSPIDPDKSLVGWSIVDGKLLGGLTSIDGIGAVKAQQIINTRNNGGRYTPAIARKLMSPKTAFDILFPAKHYFEKIYSHPESIGLRQIDTLKDCYDSGEYVVIGKVTAIDIRDRNDYQSVVKRGHKVDKDQFYLNIYIEDDTDEIKCMIPPFRMVELDGVALSERLAVDKTWLLIKGTIDGRWRSLSVINLVELDKSTGDVKC